MVGKPDSGIERVRAVADGHVKHLGVNPEDHDIQIAEQGKTYVVQYVPKNKWQLGGGVEIWVDRDSYEVVKEIHMQ